MLLVETTDKSFQEDIENTDSDDIPTELRVLDSLKTQDISWLESIREQHFGVIFVAGTDAF